MLRLWRERQRENEPRCHGLIKCNADCGRSTRNPQNWQTPQIISFSAASARSASSAFHARDQKSNCAPILKKRDCRTLVGRSHWAVAAVENALVTENGQLLLNTL